MTQFTSFWNDESGQGSAEWALLTAAVVVLVVATTSLFHDVVIEVFTDMGSYIEDNSGV